MAALSVYVDNLSQDPCLQLLQYVVRSMCESSVLCHNHEDISTDIYQTKRLKQTSKRA